MRLLLIRHGQTPANVLGELDTAAPGPGLTELGRAQAAAVPGALASERIDGIYTSELIRTHQTAAPLARVRDEMHRVVLPGLHEIGAGRLEGRRDKRSITKYLETVWAWGAGSPEVTMPGGANGHEFFGRFDADIAKIAGDQGPDATVAVFSHGAAIRVWTAARAGNISPELPGRTHLDNTGIVVLTGSPADGWLMESFAGEPIGGATLEDPSAPDPTGN